MPMELVRPIKMRLNRIHSKARTGEVLFNAFPIQFPLLFSFALEDAIRRVQEIRVELTLNATGSVCSLC
jgi:hypothetical protein